MNFHKAYSRIKLLTSDTFSFQQHHISLQMPESKFAGLQFVPHTKQQLLMIIRNGISENEQESYITIIDMKFNVLHESKVPFKAAFSAVEFVSMLQ